MAKIHFLPYFLVIGGLRTKLLLPIHNRVVDQCIIGRKIKYYCIISLNWAWEPPCVRYMHPFHIRLCINKWHGMMHKRHSDRCIRYAWAVSPFTYKQKIIY